MKANNTQTRCLEVPIPPLGLGGGLAAKHGGDVLMAIHS